MAQQGGNSSRQQRSYYDQNNNERDRTRTSPEASAPRSTTYPTVQPGSVQYGSSPEGSRYHVLTSAQAVAQANSPLEETLSTQYRVRKSDFFFIGRVFLVLWSEPSAEGNSTNLHHPTSRQSDQNAFSRGRFAELIHSRIRRFIVIREGHNYCIAVPITTYRNHGVGRARVNKSEHAIVYCGRTAPEPIPSELPQNNEYGLRPIAIRVVPDEPTDILDPMSRIDLGKSHTIHHNLKAKALGIVHRSSLQALLAQYQAVFRDDFSEGASTTPKKGLRPSVDHRFALQTSYRNLIARGETPENAIRQIVDGLVGRGLSREQAQEEVRRNLLGSER